MTVVIVETKENLIYVRDIFVEFSEISGLEINEGKTKIIRIGTRLDDLVPTTKEVAFKYAQKFTLLGVEIENKLKKLDENFKERAKIFEKKIILWRKYNLSTVGNQEDIPHQPTRILAKYAGLSKRTTRNHSSVN